MTKEALKAENARLRGYLEFIANCPCCQQSYDCEDGCTFATDCPSEWAEVCEVREILKGHV